MAAVFSSQLLGPPTQVPHIRGREPPDDSSPRSDLQVGSALVENQPPSKPSNAYNEVLGQVLSFFYPPAVVVSNFYDVKRISCYLN